MEPEPLNMSFTDLPQGLQETAKTLTLKLVEKV